MRSIIIYSLALTLSLGMFSACSDGPKPDSLDLDEDLKCTQRGASAPEWVCGNIEHDEMQLAIGHAPMYKIGASFTMSEAKADGVTKVKHDVYDYVRRKVRTFARMLDPELGKLTNAHEEEIAQAVTESEENDFKQIKQWEHPVDKELFVLVGLQNKWLDRQIEAALLQLYRQDEKTWSRFQDDDGEDELEDFFD